MIAVAPIVNAVLVALPEISPLEKKVGNQIVRCKIFDCRLIKSLTVFLSLQVR